MCIALAVNRISLSPIVDNDSKEPGLRASSLMVQV